MHTTVETARALGAPQPRTPQVQAFFDTLRREQEHYLAAIGNARSHLGKDASQLAQISAVQGRLVRRFFDAQRAILEQRADVDGEVEAVLAEAERSALAALDEAHRQLAAGIVDDALLGRLSELPPPVGSPIAASSVPQRTVPRSGARRPGGLDDLARDVDDAFEPALQGAPPYERQLDALLDEWWAAERQESKALVDDAHARAAVRVHMANVRALELLAAAGGDAGSEPVEPGPQYVSHAVPDVDEVDIDQLLVDLLADLQAPVGARATVSNELQPIEAAIISLAPPADDVPGVDAFQRFWSAPTPEPVATAAPVRWTWIPTQVVLPIVAVTAGLALVMAWIG